MERIDHLIEVARQSHHMPWVLAFLVGLFVIRKDQHNDVQGEGLFGDNVPTTLIEGIGR